MFMEILVQLFVTIIDVVIFYLATYALLHKKFEFSLTTKQARKRMMRIYGAGIVATLIISASVFVGGIHLHQIVSIFILAVLIKVISRVAFRHSVAIYIVALIVLGIVQVPTPYLFRLLGIDLMIPFAFILGQALSFVGVAVICRKLRVHKILWLLEQKLTLKISLFVLAGIFLTILFFINYEENLIQVPFYFLTLGLIITALIQVILGIDQQLNLEQPINVKEIDLIKQNILEFIDEKQQQVKGGIILDRFHYINHHTYLTETQIKGLLALLLDHAIEMQQESPIILGISVIHDQLQLIVKHKCDVEAHKDLHKHDTMKAIKKAVKRYKGVILLQHTHERTYETDYAIIIVKI